MLLDDIPLAVEYSRVELRVWPVWDYTDFLIRSRFGTVDDIFDHRTVNPS